MAEYKLPPHPHQRGTEETEEKKPNQEPIPWAWLGGGVLFALAGMLTGWFIINAFLLRPPLDAGALPPTIIVLTAPPSPIPTETAVLPTPTPIPTLTPIPTPDAAYAPAEITVGFYAAVANTDGIGVTVRGGPNVSNTAILIAPEGEVMLVVDGPVEGNGLLWWKLQLDDGVEGWAAGDYLTPTAMP